ncbi:MAG: SDR family oxidoreductase [Saprospiraceae bacterium]|nr:SDR family oxidoreductase [Saprospiraceae bacterium]
MDQSTILITGTRKGIGRYLAEYYLEKGFSVIGCSRQDSDLKHNSYQHYSLDVGDEQAVISMFRTLGKSGVKLQYLINNAGIATMNHSLLTPMSTVEKVFRTNVFGTFLFCREAAKLMKSNNFGRIVNFATVATPLNLEGESIYAASKAAIESLTRILARELADYGITVNGIGPTPTKTDLIRNVPAAKIEALLNRQAVKRFGEYRDISNCIDFFFQEKSDFITGQIIFLGGIS